MVPVSGRTNGDKIKILAFEDDTVVDISSVGGSITLRTAGYYEERTIPSSQVTTIKASKPILVVQYVKGTYDNDDGRPAMFVLPPT